MDAEKKLKKIFLRKRVNKCEKVLLHENVRKIQKDKSEQGLIFDSIEKLVRISEEFFTINLYLKFVKNF